MKKYLLYGHGGSENHGCEALVRTIVSLLNTEKQRILLSSYNADQDYKYNIDEICVIKQRSAKKHVSKYSFKFLKAYLDLKVNKNLYALDGLEGIKALGVKKNDIALSIGGDNYCYGGISDLTKENNIYRSCGLKTVLWGCSIEPEALNDKDIVEDIRNFDLITARETISYEAIKAVNPNTVLVCDSAFLLDKIELPLPSNSENCDFVGINASPLVKESESIPGITVENYCKLIENILDNTTMKILLIPHVVCKTTDDREVLAELYQRYSHTKRIFCIEDCNCQELKGYISRCRFFIGARTHATIAAYSSCVPTLVLGYSVKSKGIAKDLFGTYENYVIPVQSLKDSYALAKGFNWLIDNEETIKSQLLSIMPEYKNRINVALNQLSEL